MKKVLIALTVFIFKMIAAMLSTIKDFVLYMVAILLAILISKGIFMSIAYISQNGFGDFFGSIFAAGFIYCVLLFIGGPLILVAFAFLALLIVGAVVVITFVLNIISQVILSIIVNLLDSACEALYSKLPTGDTMRNNKVFVYLALTPAYKIAVVNFIAALPVIYYAAITVNNIVLFAEKRWDLKDMFLQFTSNQQIVCVIIGVILCLIASGIGTIIFEDGLDL